MSIGPQDHGDEARLQPISTTFFNYNLTAGRRNTITMNDNRKEITIVFDADMSEAEIRAALSNIADTLYEQFEDEVLEVNFES